MQLNCNPALGQHLTSNSQRVREISEGWFLAEGYCLNCNSLRVERTRASTEFRDFECPVCGQGYELKSATRAHTNIVQDGGYDSMMRQVRAEHVSALLLMQYDASWCVKRLLAVHPVFLTPAVIRKRPKPHIRPRTGKPYWMCDLDLTVIPPDGKIPVVQESRPVDEASVRTAYANSKRFADVPLARRGWAGLVLGAVRKVGKREFTLADVYAHEDAMHAAYPNNSHIQPKIRQQLQVLRDLGYIEFLSMRGGYRVLL